MSDINNSDDKTTSAAGRKPLTLKRKVEAGTVRQNFSHGRSKTVVVEKKRRKAVTPQDKAAAKAAAAELAARPGTAEQAGATSAPAPQAAPTPVSVDKDAERSGVILRTLTETERVARTKALEEAKVADAEERILMEEEAVRRTAEQEKEQAAIREMSPEEQAEKIRREREAEQLAITEQQAALEQLGENAKTEGKPAVKDKNKETREQPKRAQREGDAKPISSRRGERPRREGKLTIAKALDDEDRVRSLASVRRAREREKHAAQSRIGAQSKVFREVTIPEAITVEELANRMTERVSVVLRKLIDSGQMAVEEGQVITKNDVMDTDTAQLIAEEFGHTVKRVSEADVEEVLVGEPDAPEDMVARAPVVTVMGHVDHGKTSLLDALRKTDVVTGEAGGITQHIGAYQITLANGHQITFLDTPGHAAFTVMRARGAKVTDIVVLVVAADDSVMPQTQEAIDHAKAAKVPLIIAINKIDSPGANPDRVRQDLLQHEIVSEKLGGDVLEVEVSALKKTNLDKLEEAIFLQAELLELKANPDRTADGFVIESKLAKGRGPVASLLISRGTLKVGDMIVAGQQFGRVRALINDRGESIKSAGPSMPVEVLGLSDVPEPGDEFAVLANESRAREIAEYRKRKKKQQHAVSTGRGSLEQMFSKINEASADESALIIKTDVQGSLEALTGALEKLSTDEVVARIIHGGVGEITESDVILAVASQTPIIGFNVRANKQARDLAARENIEIRYYSVIYNVIDDVKAAMSGMLSPELRETFLGNAEILEIFDISKTGKVAGCRVTEGKVKRGSHVRLLRDNVVIHQGALSTLKRFKDEVREVGAGQECGMAFENYEDLKPGDTIECFDVEEVARTL